MPVPADSVVRSPEAPRLLLIDGHAVFSHLAQTLRAEIDQFTNLPQDAARQSIMRVLRFHEPTHALVMLRGAVPRSLPKPVQALLGAIAPPVPGRWVNDYASMAATLLRSGIPARVTDDVTVEDLAVFLASKAISRGFRVTVCCASPALYPLSDLGAQLCDPVTAEWIDPAQVRRVHGVAMGQIPDFCALVGGEFGGMPGALGFGPVRAAALLRQFGSLANALECLEQVPPHLRALLEGGADNIALARQALDASRSPAVSLTPKQLILKAGLADELRAMPRPQLQETAPTVRALGLG